MELKINIEDYLSKDEIKDECKSAIRSAIYHQFEKESELERLISNLSYEFLFKQVSECIGKDAEELIKNKVIELLQKDSTIKYEIFKKADAWERTEAVGLNILHSAIKDNESLIRDKVTNAIKDYNFGNSEDLKCRIQDVFAEILEEKIFHNKEDL